MGAVGALAARSLEAFDAAALCGIIPARVSHWARAAPDRRGTRQLNAWRDTQVVNEGRL